MITDEEIEKIFEWADEFGIIGKTITSNLKWGVNVKDNEKIRRGIPRDKELLLKLTHLNLIGYGAAKRFEISYLPSELCKLSNLKWIDLSDNQLKKLPESFGELKNLKELNLSCNNLKDIKILNNLNNLENLIINENEFDKNLLKFIDLKNLKYLKIDEYIFIPKDIVEKYPNIKIIVIDDAKFNELNNIKGMDFYQVYWNIGVLVRTPNIEKETLPQIEKPQKPFKNFLYKGDK